MRNEAPWIHRSLEGTVRFDTKHISKTIDKLSHHSGGGFPLLPMARMIEPQWVTHDRTLVGFLSFNVRKKKGFIFIFLWEETKSITKYRIIKKPKTKKQEKRGTAF